MMNNCMEMMGGMGGMMLFWLVGGLLLLGLIALSVLLLVRGVLGRGRSGGTSQALQLLDTRLASGDIDVQEYEQRRRLLTQR